MSPDFKSLMAACVLFLFAAGCAAAPPMQTRTPPPATEQSGAGGEKAPVTPPPGETDASRRKMETPTAKQDPRVVAALALTQQARGLIAEKRADEALRILERAVNVSPDNGEIYYYLAEAWLIKNNRAQADAYHRLAAMRLQNDGQWAARLWLQKKNIAAPEK